MSAALRIAEMVETGGVPDDEGMISFLATLLAPTYGRTVSIRSDGQGANWTSSYPAARSG